MIVPWPLRLTWCQKGKYSSSYQSGGCLFPLQCFCPFHPPVLSPTCHCLRHMSSGLENEAHILCLNHSIGRPAWGPAQPSSLRKSGQLHLFLSFHTSKQRRVLNSLGSTDKKTMFDSHTALITAVCNKKITSVCRNKK